MLDGARPETTLPSGNVTFLFTDIEGSTRLLRDLGERFHAVLTEHDDLLSDAFRRHGGHVVKHIGDALFVAFADADAAIDAAAAGQRALQAHVWPDDVRLRVRMGIHTGAATPVDGDYVALPVNQTVRVAAAAHGGQILVSEVTANRRDGSPVHDLLDLGRYRVRDFDQPVRLLQVRAPHLPDTFPQPRVPSALTTNLPRFRTTFFGREAAIASIRGAIARSQVVTLVGPGGVGKTRAAVEAATGVLDRFPHGVWFVDLARLRTGDPVLDALASTFGISLDGGDDLEDALARRIPREVLIVLDNCEHVLDDVAATVDGLFDRRDDIAIIATSREPLRVHGEVTHRLGPLSLPQGRALDDLLHADATRLLIERAQRARPGFTVGSDGAILAEIAERLDGIPLALELAAARLGDLSPATLLSGLADHFGILGGRGGAADPRHRTLDAMIAWSYDLLEPDVARVFRGLAVFPAWFDDGAVAAVLGSDPAISGALWALTDASLLVAEETDDTVRFRMLETVHAFANARLDAEPAEAARVRAAHLGWALALAEGATEKLDMASERAWRPHVRERSDDLRAAAARAMGTGAAAEALVLALALTQHEAITPTAAITLLERCLADASDPTALRARALRMLGYVRFGTGRERGAASIAKEALDLAQRLGDRELEARCRNDLGAFARGADDLPGSTAYHETALAIAREIGAREVEASALRHLGLIDRIFGRNDAAEQRYHEALLIAQEIGYSEMIVSITSMLAGLAYARGDTTHAYEISTEGLVVAQRIGSPSSISQALGSMGWAAVASGDTARARAHLDEALALARSDESRGEAALLLALSWCARLDGEPVRSADLLRRSMTITVEQQGSPNLAHLLHAGLLAAAAGAPDVGRRLAATGHHEARDRGVNADAPERAALERAFGTLADDERVPIEDAFAEAFDFLSTLRTDGGAPAP